MAKKNLNKLYKEDGWQNVFTNLGIEGKDPRTGARTVPMFLTQTEAEDFYEADDVAAKIVDRVPEEMTREGFTITTTDGKDYNQEVKDFFQKHDLNVKLEQCLKMARLYGGSALIMGLDGTGFPNEALKVDKVTKISFFTPLSRYDFQNVSELDIDKSVYSNNFLNPEKYKLAAELQQKNNSKKWNGDIHYSRMIRFYGVPVYGKQRTKVSYWGNSILARLWWPILNYSTSYDAAAVLMRDVVKIIVKLKGLHEMIAMGKDELVTKRLQLLSKTASVVNAILIEEGEECESKTTTLTGIPELLDRISNRLLTATDGFPHTILFGEGATGGIANSGESEKRDWYDYIKNKQESLLLPAIMSILEIFFSSKEGPTKGAVPEGLTIKFNPLWVPSEKDTADTRKVIAETDQIYYNMGVYDEEEIAQSRWGSGEYSIETTIDFETRAKMEAKAGQDPEEDLNTQGE